MQDGWVTAGYNALNQAIMINTGAMGSKWMFFGYDPLGAVREAVDGVLPISTRRFHGLLPIAIRRPTFTTMGGI